MENRILKIIANSFFPKRCLICNSHVKNHIRVCISLCCACLKNISFINDQYCFKCGEDIEIGNGENCRICFDKPKIYTMFRSLFIYNQHSSPLISKYKFYDSTEYARYFSQAMFEKYKNDEIFKNIDYVMPVPLSYRTIIQRMYNQSALIAKKLAKFINAQYKYEILCKYSKRNIAQRTLKTKERIENVKNSFYIKNSEMLINKNILLVDDVRTTGATLNECTKILLKSGAKTVKVITICHTALI